MVTNSKPFAAASVIFVLSSFSLLLLTTLTSVKTDRKLSSTTASSSSTSPLHNDFPLPNITHGSVHTFKEFMDEYIPNEEDRVKFVVNIGAQDGKKHDPTYPLMKDQHYQGLLFEGDETQKLALTTNMADITPSPMISWGYISNDDAVDRLRDHNVPTKFDALKIDIDSFDAHLADTILGAGYEPQIIMVEFNPDIPPPFAWHQLESGYFNFKRKVIYGNYGASAAAWYKLLTLKYGYGIVGIEIEDKTNVNSPRCEHNLWFVRGNLLQQKQQRLASLQDLTHMFWETHFRTEAILCLHVRNPCPLHTFARVGVNDADERHKIALKLSKELGTHPSLQVMANTILERQITNQMKVLCGTKEEGDKCLHHAETLQVAPAPQ